MCKRSVCVAGGGLMRTYFCDIFFLLKIHVIRLTSSSSKDVEIKLLEATMDRFVKGEMASGGPLE